MLYIFYLSCVSLLHEGDIRFQRHMPHSADRQGMI